MLTADEAPNGCCYVARSEQGERLVYDLKGRALFDPAPRHPTPSAQHVEWHSKQVFKASA
jgi:hypothetical protein